MTVIPLARQINSPAWPHFDPDEVAAVTGVLQSGKVNYWTGTEAREFEREYAEYLDVRHAIALHNGTQALELALYAFGIGEGDGSHHHRPHLHRLGQRRRHARLRAGDRRDRSGVAELSRQTPFRPLITAKNPRHHRGASGGLALRHGSASWQLAREHDLIVIEDCAQAHGAFYKGRPVGSIGHAGAFSFCQDKIMTTGGEGGLLALQRHRRLEESLGLQGSRQELRRGVPSSSTSRGSAGFTSPSERTGGCWRCRRPSGGCNCGSCPAGSSVAAPMPPC